MTGRWTYRRSWRGCGGPGARGQGRFIIRCTPSGETSTDRQVAATLNTLGHRNYRGEPFTMKKVSTVRRAYALSSRFGKCLPLRDVSVSITA